MPQSEAAKSSVFGFKGKHLLKRYALKIQRKSEIGNPAEKEPTPDAEGGS